MTAVAHLVVASLDGAPPLEWDYQEMGDGYDMPMQVVDYGHPDLTGLTWEMQERLSRVHNLADAADCDVSGCDRPVGWVLGGDDDTPGLSWRHTALVQTPPGDTAGPVVYACCEDHDPSLLFYQDTP